MRFDLGRCKDQQVADFVTVNTQRFGMGMDGLADAIEMMRQSARLTSTYGNRVALFAGAGVFRMGEAAI
ncbi:MULTISPECIES: hypothetical protein [Rhizobium]|uniref:hypothetical protein n=1 Tax=Rhizobium TaxID=379 RepID=UPI001FED5D40|nr:MULTISPECIES: hypothetical protein [Rhizobium]